MARRRRAHPPTPEALEERAKRKAEDHLLIQAEPGPAKPSGEHKCPGRAYKVSVDRVVHGKKKGETVVLCPHKGATKALVQSGHLVPQSAEPKAGTVKGADHG